MRLACWVAFLVLVITSFAITAANAAKKRPPPLHVLFIGNSLTRRNDLPRVFASIAKSAKKRVRVSMSSLNSGTFGAHVQSKQTLKLLRSRAWDVVVMQEQSYFLSVGEYDERRFSWPPALQLAQIAREKTKQPRIVLYETMAYLDGRYYESDTYELMQQRVIDGYSRLANYLGCEVAHVGATWRRAREALQLEGKSVNSLYADESHPSVKGTFLAAAAIYRQVYNRSNITNLRPKVKRAIGRAFANKAQKWADAEFLIWQPAGESP